MRENAFAAAPMAGAYSLNGFRQRKGVGKGGEGKDKGEKLKKERVMGVEEGKKRMR